MLLAEMEHYGSADVICLQASASCAFSRLLQAYARARNAIAFETSSPPSPPTRTSRLPAQASCTAWCYCIVPLASPCEGAVLSIWTRRS
jgi:hypothetical protein